MGPYGMGFPSPGFEDNGWKYYIVLLVMIITAGLTVVARLCTRYFYGTFGWDDLVVTIGLVCAAKSEREKSHSVHTVTMHKTVFQ